MKSNVEVYLTSTKITEADIKDRVVVVIDVLRASSTIATALSRGARAIIPVGDMAEAGKIASNLDQNVLLGGERGGEKIEGYHLGNSPLEYTAEVVNNRTIILNTTNGTGAVNLSRPADQVIIGCLLNASRVADYLKTTSSDIAILCAGWRNRVSLEDTLCAGLILHKLWDGTEPDMVTDSAHIAYNTYSHDKDRLVDAIQKCNHAQRLAQLGYAEDVNYCTQVDVLPVLPVYKDNRLVLQFEKKQGAARRSRQGASQE